ncbi:MAG: hypothetical protein Rhob2KO_50920 [Rhodopirellula baltica]
MSSDESHEISTVQSTDGRFGYRDRYSDLPKGDEPMAVTEDPWLYDPNGTYARRISVRS